MTTAILQGDQEVQVRVSNLYTCPLTGIVMTINHVDAKGRALTTVYYVDWVYEGASEVIKPGEATTFRFRITQDMPSPSVQVRAAVFGDGSASGDRGWAERIAQRRKFLLNSLDRVTAVISDAAATGVNSAEVVDKLKSIDHEVMADRTLSIDQKLSNQIACLEGYGNIEGNPEVKSDELLHYVLEHLKERRARIAASSPDLK